MNEKTFEALSQLPTIPGHFSRYWPSYLLACFGSFWISSKLRDNWHSIVKHFRADVLPTIDQFYSEYIVARFSSIYNTIRYNPSTVMAVAGETSLSTDINSLVKMNIDFARKANPGITPIEEKKIEEETLKGDISRVMSHYEKQISRPIFNLLFDDLLSVILIQAQHQKVELERAMLALDQLMRANELNFQLIGLFPVCLLTWFLLKQLKQLYRRIMGTGAKIIFHRLGVCLREFDRTVNIQGGSYTQLPALAVQLAKTLPLTPSSFLSSRSGFAPTSSESWPLNGGGEVDVRRYEDDGRVFFLLCELRRYSDDNSFWRIRPQFLRDLSELETLSNKQRMRTVDRMYRTYSFLR